MDTNTNRCRQLCILIGCLTIVLTGGVQSYWGSLSVYVLSYVVYKLPVDLHFLEAPLIISLFNAFWTIGFLVCGLVYKYYVKQHQGRAVIILVILLQISNISIFSTYYFIKTSFGLMNFAFGIVNCFSIGATFGTLLDIAVELSRKHVAIISALMFTSNSIGGLLIAQGITWYVNPLNKTPRLNLGSTVYFDQIDILERVPSVFLILGIIHIGTQIMGLALMYHTHLIRFVKNRVNFRTTGIKNVNTFSPNCAGENDVLNPSGDRNKKKMSRTHRNDKDICHPSSPYAKVNGGGGGGCNDNCDVDSETHPCGNSPIIESSSPNNHDNNTNTEIGLPNSDKCHSNSNSNGNTNSTNTKYRQRSILRSESDAQPSDNSIVANPNSNANMNLDPDHDDKGVRTECESEESKLNDKHSVKQLLKTPSYYALCLCFMLIDYGVTVATNYYKSFGLIWIHDDHFLSNAGTVFVILSIILQVVIGVALGRFGPSKCLISMLSVMALLSTFVYFTARLNKWLYFVTIVIYVSLEYMNYFAFFTATSMVFCKGAIAANLGFICLPSVIADFFTLFITSAILASFGWFTLFFSVACCHLVQLVCSMYLFRKQE